MANYVKKPDVLLQTLLAYLHSPRGTKVVRVLFDSASQSSYIRSSLAKELGLVAEGKESVIHQTFGAVLSNVMEHTVVRVEISGLHAPYNQRYNFTTSMVDTIAQNIISAPPGSWFEECNLKGIKLTDVTTKDVDIMIGNDVSPYLQVNMKSIILASGMIARETKIGWLLEGQLPGTSRSQSTKAMICVNMLSSDQDVQNYWALDAIGIKDPFEEKSRKDLEEAAMCHFTSTVEQDVSGRYVVHLPWIEGHPSLPENKQLAYIRLGKTTRDLVKDGYLSQYDDIFRQWESEGIIEKINEENPSTSLVHYLGHRAVYKEGSTTPLRPVFNGSGKVKNRPSLNDCLEKGPNLLEMIPSILLKFRMNRIGVTADIRKAFLQLQITPMHRDSLRFLWWENVQTRRKVITFRHCRVVFGATCSPFLLGAVIKHLLSQKESIYPKTVELLRSSFYVDNCVASLPTMEEAEVFSRESQSIFSGAQMDLRGWEYGPSSDGKLVPLLGHVWDTSSDKLSFDIEKILKLSEPPRTKRTVLALANSIFDPLGFLCPYTIGIKIIFKKICCETSSCSWDSDLPDTIIKQVECWRRQLPDLKDVQIPRHVAHNCTSRTEWSIHAMSDASRYAYSCCIYLRTGINSVQLLQAKSRVMPSKVLTIPRAELLGCLISTRLYTQVCKDLKFHDIPVTFWTDATTALIWITKLEAVWTPWVNRRVEEIRKLTDVTWKHVPGELNYADHPSRGISVNKYMELRWWEGPTWLRGPASDFPSSTLIVDDDAVNKEKRKTVVSFVTIKEPPSFLDNLARLGDWHRILNAVAFVVRFINNKFLKRKTNSSQQAIESTTSEEIKQAEIVIIRLIQQQLTEDQLMNFHLKKDENGLIRIITKLTQDDDSSFAYPIVLPGKHPLIRLMIYKEHSLSSHAGVHFMLAHLRSRFWIVNSRCSVKSVIHTCPICRVHMAKRCKVKEAPLPLHRIKTTHCFDVVGVDLAGPLVLKNGEKVWVVLYTCAVYRAVHLELVTSLSTEAFLQCLRKFVARKGRPSTIYSDNGTNFVGCQNLFKSVDWSKVSKYASVKRINWIFNPPTAAWWGGWWERLVGLSKQLLRRVLGSRSVYYSELEVLLVEVESVLNERPLTYVSEDPSDLRPLTPSHFLKDLPLAILPEADIADSDLRKAYKHIQRLREELRTRFRKEYLAQLVGSSKVKKSLELRPGDVVLVEADNRKRIEWPMGVVVEVYPGKDGICRTAKVRTTHGELIRPFQRLFPLEMNREESGIDISKMKTMTNPDQDVQDNKDADNFVMDGIGEKAKPLIITKCGRKVVKPDRLGFQQK